jgi:uncharacterized protein (TIGR03435 family)
MAASVKFLIPFSLLVSAGAQLPWRTAPAIGQSQLAFAMDEISQPFAAPVRTPLPAVAAPALNPLPAILFAAWLCGIAVGIVFWFRWWWQIRSLKRAATPLDLNLPVKVLSSPTRLEPGVFGIRKPFLLLPEGITERLTPPQLEAILAHELRHVRRRDNLTAAIHMLVETIFWFHPLVWWIRARLMEERERACDEGVLRMGSEPQVYAESIIKVCEFYLASPVACAAGVTGGKLKRRIEGIVANRASRNLGIGQRLLLAAAALAALCAPIAIGLMSAPPIPAQSLPTPGAVPAFDVASVKPNRSTDRATFNFPLGPGDLYTPNGGYFSATNVSLAMYVSFAYKLMGNQLRDLLDQSPPWIEAERFDIQARVKGNPSKDQMRLMMRSLLADRFKLAVHEEDRQVAVAALVVAKGGKLGPQIQPHPSGSPCPTDPDPFGTNSDARFPLPCGGLVQMSSAPGRLRFGARNVTMDFIANQLSAYAGLGRPLVDRTGLSGAFDFNLEWTPATHGPDEQVDEAGPTFGEALGDQLGLKLESQKGSLSVLVIDHVERPSKN